MCLRGEHENNFPKVASDVIYVLDGVTLKILDEIQFHVLNYYFFYHWNDEIDGVNTRKMRNNQSSLMCYDSLKYHTSITFKDKGVILSIKRSQSYFL